MNPKVKYGDDIKLIFSKRGQFGGENWTTVDQRIGKGSPFSTRDVGLLLTELGFTKKDKIIQEISETIFKTWRADGRFRISPSGSIFPCHTITALRTLCYLGNVDDDRLKVSFDHLFNIQHTDGGWRCNAVKLGKSPDTDVSNPGVTLEALDAFRFTNYLNRDQRLNRAIEFLLNHWTSKRPLGPCQFGIGTLFRQTEFPFLRYNIFYYCHTLSFYEQAVSDSRFKEALSLLEQKLMDGKLIIENPNRRLAKMKFCEKGKPSDLATIRFKELIRRAKPSD